MEGTGFHEDINATFSDKSKRQLRFMEQSIEHDRVRYKTSLRWKSEVETSNNYPVDIAQLQSLQKWLKNYPKTMEFYEKLLTTDLENNYVKSVIFQYPQPELL